MKKVILLFILAFLFGCAATTRQTASGWCAEECAKNPYCGCHGHGEPRKSGPLPGAAAGM